ncbi:acyl--CoA ligase [Shimia sp. R10_1]|uniref:class I adenylate-forming enzyme family protein n=1 Tax=Shimia sp. R10_1 TaxID=2821095 RepID=UPI001ADBDC7C|nr:class I adenylate-forming enzyme family protein [Shimia sp. R10_1]MBO9472307.1 acyl--CoA ligase [Shimia sp. R10_1]
MTPLTISLFDQGPPAACPKPFNMAAHVLRHADALSEKPALEVLSETGAHVWTYGALKSAILGTAAGLLHAGFKPGDPLLMRLGNTVDFPIAYLAAIAVGLIPVPTSAQLTAPEVARIIDTLAPAAVLHDPAVATAETATAKNISTADLHDMRNLPPADFAMGDPNRPAYIIYTSGTSGQPRAVVHAHRAIWARQMMFDGWYGLRRDDRLLHAGAFNWTFTLGTGLMDPWTIGATALIPEADTPPAALPNLLHQHQATLFAAAPGVYRKMLDTPEDPALPTLRHGLCAGEKLSEPLRQRWQEATGTALYEAFGMSECSTFISASPTAPAPASTLGQPQSGRRIAILKDGQPAPLNTPGVIAIHKSDAGLMRGYFNAPEETAARFDGEWFLTGDLGAMDAQGHITYMGRADDMMNAGGFRLSPLEVEAALATHPDLATIAVTDVEIKADTRVIAAFYTADHDLVEADLKAFAAARLARYKQPRLYIRLPVLPTNANGKLNRRALRTELNAQTLKAKP